MQNNVSRWAAYNPAPAGRDITPHEIELMAAYMRDNWLIAQQIDLTRGSFSTTPATRISLAGDCHAHTWQISIASDGMPADLSGFTARAYMVRPDGATVITAGAIEGNAVSFVLPEQAYALPGRVRGIARIMRDSDCKIVTLSEIRLEIIDGITNLVVDPGKIMPDLGGLAARIDELRDALKGTADLINIYADTIKHHEKRIEELENTITGDLAAHLLDYSNPHRVTIGQLGQGDTHFILEETENTRPYTVAVDGKVTYIRNLTDAGEETHPNDIGVLI
jgi:hypothetical protein